MYLVVRGLLYRVMTYALIDMHNDLLSYLAADVEKHTPYDRITRSSIDQYKNIGAEAVVFVAFATHDDPGHELALESQYKIYNTLFSQFPDLFCRPHETKKESQIYAHFAIEGASTFALDDEPLEDVIHRYEQIAARPFFSPLYVSLTWNGINRFGTGARATKKSSGLTEDGKILIDYLHDRIHAFDLSHLDDTTARDLLDYTLKKGYRTSIVASHSNLREVFSSDRNIPDDIAKEIIRREGIIGLNCIQPFVGKTSDAFLDHVGHMLSLGGEDHIALGADFFAQLSLPKDYKPLFPNYFFSDIPDVEALPGLFARIEARFGMKVSEGIASANWKRWYACL